MVDILIVIILLTIVFSLSGHTYGLVLINKLIPINTSNIVSQTQLSDCKLPNYNKTYHLTIIQIFPTF